MASPSPGPPRTAPIEERGIALVGADGIWSACAARLGDRAQPRFTGHTAWRALAPADDAPHDVRAPTVNLWLGRDAHLVHYPVKGGQAHQCGRDRARRWSERRLERRGRTPRGSRPVWHGDVAGSRRATSSRTPRRWQKWALYDRPPLRHWGEGPVTLLGDAAHPMLPYLAQGGAMAIEDAAVLGRCLAPAPDDVAGAMRRYERERRRRTARAQRAAQRNESIYHMGGAAALLRSVALAMGGSRLIRHYDWLYGWKLCGGFDVPQHWRILRRNVKSNAALEP